jgi:hypothetical protein
MEKRTGIDQAIALKATYRPPNMDTQDKQRSATTAHALPDLSSRFNNKPETQKLLDNST